MSQWNPIWKLEINGIDYTNLILSNLTITSGRTDIYNQAQAGYCNIELVNLDQTNYQFEINQSVTISVQDSTATFVPIFGGTITDSTIKSGTNGFRIRKSITSTFIPWDSSIFDALIFKCVE